MTKLKLTEHDLGESRPVFIKLCVVSSILEKGFLGLRVISSSSFRKSMYDTLWYFVSLLLSVHLMWPDTEFSLALAWLFYLDARPLCTTFLAKIDGRF